MPRFFIDYKPPKDADTILVSGENARHISRSLRMRLGEELILCDGLRNDYYCEVLSIDDDSVTAKIIEKRVNETEPDTRLRLYQCLAKNDKLETVIQKAVELGVYEIVPVVSERCVVRWDEKTILKKKTRMQKISLEAAKQSGRGIIPNVQAAVTLRQAAQMAEKSGDIIVFYECGGESLNDIIPETKSELSVFIGPEGGFAPHEIELLQKSGARVASLGKRILRTETAPIAAISIIMFEKGEMQ